MLSNSFANYWHDVTCTWFTFTGILVESMDERIVSSSGAEIHGVKYLGLQTIYIEQRNRINLILYQFDSKTTQVVLFCIGYDHAVPIVS